MKTKILAGAAIAAAALAMSGCHIAPGVVMDKSKPIDQGKYSVVSPEVSATEMQVYLFGIPMADLRGSAGRRMYKNALRQALGADALIEYTPDTKTLNLCFMTFQWYTLTGTAVKTTNK